MRLIDADALFYSLFEFQMTENNRATAKAFAIAQALCKAAPTIDAVPVEHLKSWLLEIAFNNTGNALGDSCEELVLRIEKGGLTNYVRDREEKATN